MFLVMNPGYNADNWKIIQDNAKLLGIPLTVFESDIFDTVADDRDRIRAICVPECAAVTSILQAKELGCNKIALGTSF